MLLKLVVKITHKVSDSKNNNKMNNICASKPAPPTVIMMSSIANLQLRSTTRRQKRRERAALIVIVSVTALASALSGKLQSFVALRAAASLEHSRTRRPTNTR